MIRRRPSTPTIDSEVTRLSELGEELRVTVTGLRDGKEKFSKMCEDFSLRSDHSVKSLEEVQQKYRDRVEPLLEDLESQKKESKSALTALQGHVRTWGHEAENRWRALRKEETRLQEELKTGLDELRQKHSTVEKQNGTLSGKVDAVDQRSAKLETDLEKVDRRHHDGIQVMRRQLEALEAQVSLVARSFQELNETQRKAQRKSEIWCGVLSALVLATLVTVLVQL